MPKVLNRPVVIGGEDNLNPFFADELTKIVFSPDLGVIPAYACYEKKNLEEVVIPEGITEIKERAFSGCEKLAEVVLPEGFTKLGQYSLSIGGRDTPATVYLPSTLTSASANTIGPYCTEKYFNMTLEEWLAKTSMSAFISESTNFTADKYKIYLKNNENEYYLLEDLVIPSGMTRIRSYAFAMFQSIKSITIPEGITTIDNSAFKGLNQLTDISLPQSLTTIYDYAFYNAMDLTELVIPQNVSYIGAWSFRPAYSPKKLTVIMEPTTPPSIGGSSTFGTINKIFVPTGTKAAYLANST